jgi:phosphatidylserine decarboxylase
VQWLYSTAREQFPYLFKLATSPFASRLLAYLNYDAPLPATWSSASRLLKALDINAGECVRRFDGNVRLRDIFERQIRYWQCRPLPPEEDRVVSPCDARILIGSFTDQSLLPVKEKFFDLQELICLNKVGWQERFADADWVILRLTPEKYHYNHFPVGGKVVDVYTLDGCFHSCNPGAVVEVIAPYSKNRRSVTIIDTDVAGGTGVGLVAMIEVVALMIGEIVQCYAEHQYAPAGAITKGCCVKRGAVKSLFRPGSSTVITLFEAGRVAFDPDLVRNTYRQDATSRFSNHFGRPLVETEVQVRSSIARAAGHSRLTRAPGFETIIWEKP